MLKNELTTTAKTKTTTVKLSTVDLVELLKQKGINAPKDAEVKAFVTVPGGGDWSNADLDINDCNVTVTIKETTVTA